MQKMKKFMSVVLTLAMLIGMLVLPVSAGMSDQTIAMGEVMTVTDIPAGEETVDHITLNQPIPVVIPVSEKIQYAFTPEEDGTYIVHTDAQNSPIFAVCQAHDGMQLAGTRWVHPTSYGSGYAYQMNKGVTYIIELENRHLYPNISGNLAVNRAELYQSFEITGDSTAFPGQSVGLWITGSPAYAMETLTGTSSNPEVAQITSFSNTYLTLDCLAPGTTVITVAAPGGASVSYELTVQQPLTLTLDEPLSLDISNYMSEGVDFTAPKSGMYIFYCADGGILSMEAHSKDGTIRCTAHDWGNTDGTLSGNAFYMIGGRTYTVTMTNYGSSRTFRLTAVKAEDYTSLSFPQDAYTGRVDSIIRLKAITDPEFAREEVTWSSSDSSVVSIYNTDNLSQVADLRAPGEAIITLSTKDGRISTSCKITVTEKPVLQLDEGVELIIARNKYEILKFTPAEDGKYLFYVPGQTYYRTEAYDLVYYEDLVDHQWQSLGKQYSGYVFDMVGGCQYEVVLWNDWLENDLTTTLTAVKVGDYASIRLDQSEIVTSAISFHALNLITSPEFAYEEVTWSCSDPDMVSLFSSTSMGTELFVQKGGTATITATTESGLSASCVVTTEPPNSFVINETREIQLYAGTPYTKLYFTAPADGTYTFYRSRDVSLGMTVSDTNTGKEFGVDYYFKGGSYHAADFELTAGQSVCFTLHYYGEEDVLLKVGVGQLTPVQEILLSHEEIVVGPLSWVLLEQTLLPVMSNDETITITSSNEDVAFYEQTDRVDDYVCHAILAWDVGEAIITVTSESGATATCKVVIIEPTDDIKLGTHTTDILPAGGYALYTFIPESGGTYTVSDTCADSVLDMHIAHSSIRGEDWSSGATAGSKLEVAAGQQAWVSVKNDSDMPQAVTFMLTEGYHEHVFYFVREQAPDYGTPGMKAHHACACGILYNEEGTEEVTAEDLLIPQLIQVENGKTEIGEEVLDHAVADAEIGGEVRIPVADAGDVESVAMPVASLTQAADKNASLTLEMSAATVTIDSTALAAVVEKAGENASVTLEVQEVAKEDLTESQVAAIEELDKNLVTTISAELLANDQAIASEADGGFGGGKVTVKIAIKLSGEFDVLYIADDGTVTKIENATYEDGILTLELEHFSDYAIVQDTLLGDVNGDGSVTVLDLMRLANFFAGKDVEINEGNANVNGDDKVTVLDLMRLANFFAGKAELG